MSKAVDYFRWVYALSFDGIDPEMIENDPIDAMDLAQKKICAICRFGDTKVVDHDHYNGFVRGMLCRACNVREGRAKRGDGRADVFLAYRSWCPAVQLGIGSMYYSPYRDMTQRRFGVDSTGIARAIA